MVERFFRTNSWNAEPFSRERIQPYVRQFSQGLRGVNYYRAMARRIPRRLREVDVPALLIWGERDPALGPWFHDPSRYEAFCRRFERVLIQDSGHFPHLEAPEAVNAALREHFAKIEAEVAA